MSEKICLNCVYWLTANPPEADAWQAALLDSAPWRDAKVPPGLWVPSVP